MIDAIRRIQEDKVAEWRWMLNVMPLARTPDSKKGASALQRYSNSLHRALSKMTPWKHGAEVSRLKKLRDMPRGDKRALAESEALAERLYGKKQADDDG